MSLEPTRDRPAALLVVLVLALACGASRVVADPVRPPIDPTACRAPSDCRLVWTLDDVCGRCGVPQRGHTEALSGSAAAERLDVGCPACAQPVDPSIFATCVVPPEPADGHCEVVDLLESELARCDTPADCTIVRAGAVCELRLFVSARRGSEETLTRLWGRAPLVCEDAPGPSVEPICRAGHCLLPQPMVGTY